MSTDATSPTGYSSKELDIAHQLHALSGGDWKPTGPRSTSSSRVASLQDATPAMDAVARPVTGTAWTSAYNGSPMPDQAERPQTPVEGTAHQYPTVSPEPSMNGQKCR